MGLEAKLVTGSALRERVLALARHGGPEKGVPFERWLVDTLPKLTAAEIVRVWRWPDSPCC